METTCGRDTQQLIAGMLLEGNKVAGRARLARLDQPATLQLGDCRPRRGQGYRRKKVDGASGSVGEWRRRLNYAIRSGSLNRCRQNARNKPAVTGFPRRAALNIVKTVQQQSRWTLPYEPLREIGHYPSMLTANLDSWQLYACPDASESNPVMYLRRSAQAGSSQRLSNSIGSCSRLNSSPSPMPW